MHGFVACSGENATKYTVTYVTNSGSSISATSNQRFSITAPAEPTKDDLYSCGWFFDGHWNKQFISIHT